MLLYVGCSIALGALSGVRSLCFSLIGRRITVSVRNTLFRSVVVQDIAFFDGMRVGDITQRMTGDVRAMVSPVTSTLSRSHEITRDHTRAHEITRDDTR